MAFEWDPAKNQANITKHGVSFETAKRIFDGLVRKSRPAGDAWASTFIVFHVTE